MNEELDGKVALVTGGSRGIGAAVAKALARSGADVAFTFRASEKKAEEVAREVTLAGRRGLAVRSDASDPEAGREAVERTARELGGVDILVNNAGVFPFGPVEEVSREELDTTLAIHIGSVFVTSQAASAHMDSDGRIISIGSCFVERVPVPGVSLYTMSKAALVGLTKGLARDLGPRGITANVVHPGNTNTDMNPADAPDAEVTLRDVALGRFAEPDEIAATVVHLSGPGGRYITGASIAVDGGFAA
jgi:NAD(P)-dependent dehydrogenase (short-subunit alcohol dehydrogenase family)